MSVPLPSYYNSYSNQHRMADRCPWQQKALFLNGNLAEKRRAERLGMMAHLLLAHSAQSLPLAQPESSLSLLTMPASPFLALALGTCCWTSPSCVAKLHQQPQLPRHSAPRLPASSLLLALLLPWEAPCPSSLSPVTVPLPVPSQPPPGAEHSSLRPPPPFSSVSSLALHWSFP